MEFNFKEIVSHFSIGGEYVDCVRFGEGHINDTFKLTVNVNGKIKHYILQRINDTLFCEVDKLMRNIELVTDFCRQSVLARGGDPERECMTIVKTVDGKPFSPTARIISGSTCL